MKENVERQGGATASRTENRRIDLERELAETWGKLLYALYKDGLKQERSTLDKALGGLEELLRCDKSSIQLCEFVEAARRRVVEAWERGSQCAAPELPGHCQASGPWPTGEPSGRPPDRPEP